jgi:hypothetical protein
MNWLGTLQGVGVGLGVSVLLLAYKFYLVGVVKFASTNAILRSNIDRTIQEREYLDR